MKLPKTTGSNSMTQGRSTNRAFIDYVSFVFDLEELNALKHKAKINLGLNPELSYNAHYKDLLTPDAISAYDNVLSKNISDFLYQLNHTLNKEKQVQRQLNPDFEKWEIHNNHHGRFSYKHSANLTCEGVNAGIVCWGSENYGAMVSISGTGCQAINMKRLYKIVKQLGYVRISRVDLAHDDYDGIYGISEAKKMYRHGLFSLNNMVPNYRYIESGHLDYSTPAQRQGKLVPSEGRSLYIGKRKNGKMCRIYEKGKQLKSDNLPNWVRWEVELRNVERVIPLEVLLEPTKYMAAAYPCLNHLSQEQIKIKVFKEKIDVSFQHLIKYQRLGYGKLVNFARHVLQWTDKDIVDELVKDLSNHTIPNRIKQDALIPNSA
jgi:DNA relaxase NicK